MRILIADDDKPLRDILAESVSSRGHRCACASDGVEALSKLREGGFDVLITDIKMPRMDGLELLRKSRSVDPSLSVVVLTGHASVESAVSAMRDGAADYLTKPFGIDELLLRLDRLEKERSLARENAELRRELGQRYHISGASPIVGSSPAMVEIEKKIAAVSLKPTTVLITGESGTGKDLVARAIHYSGTRAEGPFVALNCSSISKSLLESQLFGHVKGSFTGAVCDSRGFFVAAEGGTLFLDEIAEIDTGTQAKLLRSLQEKQVVPVGSTEAKLIDVRIIAATNRDLDEALSSGALREDLYYRINVVSIHLPPLRDRAGDVGPLAAHFVRKYAAEYGVAERRIGPEARKLLDDYMWPGNVRELENIIERAFALSEGPEIARRDLPPEITGDGQPRPGTGRFERVMPRTLAEAEKGLIERSLAITAGNKKAAAERLGIDRKRLYRLIAKHGIEV